MIEKDDLTLLGILGAVGVAIGIGKMLVSDEKLTARLVIGRAIVHGGLGLCTAAATLVIPGLTFAAQVGIACVLASLGTSALEALFNRVVKK